MKDIKDIEPVVGNIEIKCLKKDYKTLASLINNIGDEIRTYLSNKKYDINEICLKLHKLYDTRIEVEVSYTIHKLYKIVR